MPLSLANRFYRSGFIDLEQVNLAKKLAHSLPENGPLDPILTISDLSENQAQSFLAQMTGLDPARASLLADFQALSLQGCPLSEGYIQYFEIIPVSWVNHVFVIVVADPTHLSLLKQIEFLSDCKVACKIGTLSQIQDALRKRFPDYQPKTRVWQRSSKASQGGQRRSTHHEGSRSSAQFGDFRHGAHRDEESQDQDFENWGPSLTKAPRAVSVDDNARTQEEVFGDEGLDLGESSNSPEPELKNQGFQKPIEEITSEEGFAFGDEPTASSHPTESEESVSLASSENFDSIGDLGGALDELESDHGELADPTSQDEHSLDGEELSPNTEDEEHDTAPFDSDFTELDLETNNEDLEISLVDGDQDTKRRESTDVDSSALQELSTPQLISRIQLMRTRMPEHLLQSDMQNLLDQLSKHINKSAPVTMILKKEMTCLVLSSASPASHLDLPTPSELIAWYEASSPGLSEFYHDTQPYGTGLVYEPQMPEITKIAWVLCEMPLDTAQLLDSSFQRLSSKVAGFTFDP